MFSHRSGSSSGISPSNSAHFSNTASPNSSADANAMSKGFANARRTTLKLREASGTSKLSKSDVRLLVWFYFLSDKRKNNP